MKYKILLIDSQIDRRLKMAQAFLNLISEDVTVHSLDYPKNTNIAPYFSLFLKDKQIPMPIERHEVGLNHDLVFIHSEDNYLLWTPPNKKTPCIWYGGARGKKSNQPESPYHFSIYRRISSEGSGVLNSAEAIDILQFISSGLGPKKKPDVLNPSGVDPKMETMVVMLESLLVTGSLSNKEEINNEIAYAHYSDAFDHHCNLEDIAEKEKENFRRVILENRKENVGISELEHVRQLHQNVAKMRSTLLQQISQANDTSLMASGSTVDYKTAG